MVRTRPIETPEGPNIGLISYLASFARIDQYGFIEAPYRRVDKATGKVLDEVVYMTADVEDEYVVAQANEPLTAGKAASPTSVSPAVTVMWLWKRTAAVWTSWTYRRRWYCR